MSAFAASIIDRRIAFAVGALFVAGMVIGITGSVLIQSVLSVPGYLSTIVDNSMKISIGAVLWLLTVAGDAAHGILMYPVIKRYSETIAVGYLGSRIIDAVFIGVHILFVLVQIPIGKEFLTASAGDASYFQVFSTVMISANLYAYNIAMLTLGVAGLLLCYAMYATVLVPRVLAVWGLVGYATILLGSIAEVMGYNLQFMHTLPGGLWELFIGVWLMVKGFKQPVSA